MTTKQIREVIRTKNIEIGVGLVSKDTWSIPFSVCKEIKLIEIQWKILHRIYPTNILLKKMNIKQTDICEFCEQNDLDTLEHFFYHCSKINQLWENVGNEIHVKINEKYALFGIPLSNFATEKEYKNANKLLLIAKKCISMYKYGTYCNITALFEGEKAWRKMYNL